MNIVISGYGKMGSEVEKAALAKGDQIIAKVDCWEDWDIFQPDIKKADAIIDFSEPGAALDIIIKSFKLKIPIITGTTGWYDKLDYVTEICNEKKGTLFFAPNFSIGVNVFFKVNEVLARLMNNIEGYRIKLKETHHIHKLDKPSGTAIKAGEDIIKNNNLLNNWVNHTSKNLTELSIISKRKGEVTGTHKVSYKSDVDELELRHKAKNRSGFALGALLAAEFVKNKQGVFTMEDLLKY